MATEAFRRSLKKHQEAAAALAAAAVDGASTARGELSEPQLPLPTELSLPPHDKEPSQITSVAQDTRPAEHTDAAEPARSDSSATSVAKQGSVLSRVFQRRSFSWNAVSRGGLDSDQSGWRVATDAIDSRDVRVETSGATGDPKPDFAWEQ
ncbi:hypothetical protein PybrP1_012383 [[Pythium] brassicae (nom. inval.)]|nr:hypothetical protein PybrP1_012383 [[Pythium] brassicae (nom. inval.)]